MTALRNSHRWKQSVMLCFQHGIICFRGSFCG
nr:MAG TPA: hypothetical protein [Caudoviricetes sp.]